jgi:hypothetical protein
MNDRVVPEHYVVRLGQIALALPDAYEEPAWIGTRWRVRKRTFGHVLPVEDGWPPAYARAADAEGPTVVLTFRLPLDELDALVRSGERYFRARWGRDVAGIVLDDDVDWDEVRELLTESYCVLAPKKLVALVPRPGQM